MADPTLALNDPSLGLDFHTDTRQLSTTRDPAIHRPTHHSTINIDLDGIAPAADTTLNSLAASISAVANVTATVLPDGRVQIDSSGNDFEFSFGPDLQPGDEVPEVLMPLINQAIFLHRLGINTFFSGASATTLRVNTVIQNNPAMISALKIIGKAGNLSALAIAGLT